jgi:CheY-like chemotaxis protein
MDSSFMSSPELDGLHILFVDDSEDERELFQVRFGMLGARIVAVGSAGEALAAIASEETDVVVCDLTLPDVDGCDLIRTLRDDQVAGAIPVIAATGRSGKAEQERALAAGFSAFVTKPYDTEEIVCQIDRLRSQIEACHHIRARCRRQHVEQRALHKRLLKRHAELEASNARFLDEDE